MTHDEAIAEVQRRQAADPDATWIATERNGTWVVARIGLQPPGPTGTAIKPPPPAPHETPQSELQRVVTQFGIG